MTPRKRTTASKKGWITRRVNAFKKRGFSGSAAVFYVENRHDSDRLDALLQTREIALMGGPVEFKKRFKGTEPGEEPIISGVGGDKDNVQVLKDLLEENGYDVRWYLRMANYLGYTEQEARTVWFSPKARKGNVD